MSYYEQTRLLVAKREDEEMPYVIAAMPQSTWEVYDPAEYDDWKRNQAKRFFDADWTAYDYVEVIITIPEQQLKDLFEARDITPASIEVAGDE